MAPCKLSSIIEYIKIFTRELLETNTILKNVNLMFGDLKRGWVIILLKNRHGFYIKFRTFTTSNVVIKKKKDEECIC